MTCIKRIVVIARTKVEGSLGTVKWFIPYTQYCYEDIQEMEIGCDCHAITGTLVSFYRIVINGEDFLLPKEAGAWDVRDLPANFQNWRLFWEAHYEQPNDMWKTAKQLLGIDIKAGNCVVHNGYDLYNKIKGSSTQEEVGSDSEK